jgi:hypothetical protein
MHCFSAGASIAAQVTSTSVVFYSQQFGILVDYFITILQQKVSQQPFRFETFGAVFLCNHDQYHLTTLDLVGDI